MEMKAGVATVDGLAIRSVPRPAPGAEQVLVRVMAAGMNRADLLAARGQYSPADDAQDKPIGMEWAGEVVEVGSDVKDIRVGQRIMCSGSGGYAQYAVADHKRTISLEGSSLSFEQAAVLPLALLTAHDAVVTHGRLAQGDSVLVQGASSAVGLMCLQIARSMGAGFVIGTSTNEERRSKLQEYGADLAIDPLHDDWPEQVLAATEGKGVQLVVDMVSGRTVNQNMQASSILGRIVNVGRLGGGHVEFDCDLHAKKRLDYIGVTFRTRSVEEVREINRKMLEDLWSKVLAGDISLPIDRSFSLDEAPQAHAHMAANQHFGKIVLKPHG